MSKTPKDPLAIPYKRWRNRQHRYLVDVVNVRDYSGSALQTYRTVRVRRVKGALEREWPAKVFLESFEPVGRKIRKKSAWEILSE